MNTTAGDALNANIYQACNDEYKRGITLNRDILVSSSSHEVRANGQKLDIVIDKDADDLNDVFQSQGVSFPPDEILESVKTSTIKIPVKFRNEFPKDAELPSSDILKALHYYASKKMSKSNERFSRILDETALLELGIIVEEWIDNLIDDNTAKVFTNTPEAITSDSEYTSGNSSNSDSDSDTDNI